MKRILCSLLIICLCSGIVGCGFAGQEEAKFYYRQAEFQYGAQEGAIIAENHSIAGHEGDLPYLIMLYLSGPVTEEIRSPFPKNTLLVSATQEKSSVVIELSSLDASLTDSEFSLACACMTLTCIDITGAHAVTINSGSRSVTITADTLVLYDDCTPTETTNGG